MVQMHNSSFVDIHGTEKSVIGDCHSKGVSLIYLFIYLLLDEAVNL